jgi:hypothetical protein
MKEKIKLLVAGGANFLDRFIYIIASGLWYGFFALIFSALAFYFMAETIKTARDYINLKEGEKQ